MKNNFILTLFLLLSTSFVFSQTFIIGKVTDADTGEDMIAANVLVYKNGNFIQGETTDIDGNYSIRVDPGTYDLEVNYTGYPSQKIEGIVVTAGSSAKVDVQLSVGAGAVIDEIVVTGYKVPLIKQDETSSGSTITMGGNRRRSSGTTRRRNRKSRKRKKDASKNNYTITQIPVSAQGQTYISTTPKPKKSLQNQEGHNTEEYSHIAENEFLSSLEKPLSTFSIDVDNASYSNVRRFLNAAQMPPKDAVRVEEFINYFNYDYPQPNATDPFSINTEISDCPWNENHKLVHIGLQGYELPKEQMPPSNLVFLIDVSGSMSSQNKLPLLIKSFQLLTQQLRQEDKISIVVYAGASGLVLPPTSGGDKNKITEALGKLKSGGSTAGAAGIQLAYKTAESTFIKDGNNRIILATDGDFNVGTSSTSELVRLIEEKRKSGVFLSVLGFGMGNYKDNRMEQLADNGNGNYSYIDNFQEAKKVFVQEMGGTLHTIAKDVKLQIEFNPTHVKEYRLVGYENRKLKNEDFNNDKKDAGDLGAGHTVTAIYEIIPEGSEITSAIEVDALKYQRRSVTNEAKNNSDWMTIKLRYKKSNEDVSKLLEVTAKDNGLALDATSDNFRFSAAVANFAILLRDSKFKGSSNYDTVLDLGQGSIGKDEFGYRKEFLDLVKKTKEINIRMTAKK